MNHRFTPIFLFLSGLLLLAIGGGILLVPHGFYGSNGIVLGDDPSFMSEIRAPGGLLAASAVLILVATFRRHLRSMATGLTVLVYGSFGLARLLGFALDGMPSSGLVASTLIELVVAAIGCIILWRSGPALAQSSQGLTSGSAEMLPGTISGSAPSIG